MKGVRLEQESLEEAIAQVKGVFACQVVLDEERRVQEIHAIGTAQRGAKQIVRDVETLLRVRFGQFIDYRKISLVQLDEAAARFAFVRPQLAAVTSRMVNDGYAVTVVLQQGDREFLGVAGTGHTLAERLKLSAQATVNAVSQLAERADSLRLADAAVISLGGQDVATVAVKAWFPTGEENLAGLSLLRREDDLVDELLAAGARATLSALNRRLPLILSPSLASSPKS